MRRSLACLAIALVYTVPSLAKGEMVSLYPVSDRSGEDRPNVNTGALYDGLYDTLFEDRDQYLDTFHSQGKWEMRSGLEFDMQSVPADSSVISATLFVQTATLGAGTFPTHLIVDGYSGNGIVELRDLSAANRVGVLDFPTPGELPPLSLDATAFIQSLQEVGGTHAGFVLRTVPGATISIASSETTYTSPPRLDIEFQTAGVPEPSMIHLVVAGAVICGFYFAAKRLFLHKFSG